jgi:hypothetical protein
LLFCRKFSVKKIRPLHSFISLLLIIGYFYPNRSIALEIDHQFWMNYALSIPINEQLSWGGDLGVRGLGTNKNWNQLLIRPTISYKFKKPISIAGAMAWFGTFNIDKNNISEFRIHQDFNAKWPDFGMIEFFYRIRLEQRFFFYQNELPNASRVRVRALIGIETQDLKWFGAKRPIYFQSILEGFKTLDKNEALEVFINQNRLHIAIGHRISNSFRYELHYIAQRAKLFSAEGTSVDHNIYRIRLIHRLNAKNE